ncbi:hypothetical protein Tco_1234812 [Tanacetum coccineum]
MLYWRCEYSGTINQRIPTPKKTHTRINVSRSYDEVPPKSKNDMPLRDKMDDLNITMEEYIRLEEEKLENVGICLTGNSIAFNDGVSSEKTLSVNPRLDEQTRFDTMGLDEQKVKKSTGAVNDEKNLAFLTTSGASSTTNINTVNPEISTCTTKVNTASTETSTASFSDATVYAFLSTQPQGSQLVHEDLEQLHDDDFEEMDLKWNMALLSMRASKFYQRTGRKIIIDRSSTVGAKKGTASEEAPIVSTAEVNLSIAGQTVTYTRRSAEKRSRQDKGKAIMIESEPKKKSKKELEQERLSFADAIRLEEQMNEEQRAQIERDEEITRQWDEKERQRAMAEAKSTKQID